MEEDQTQSEQNWKPDTPDKGDKIASGQWIQKAVWNRMVTMMERDQTHKTQVTSTWTADYLTREGEEHKAMWEWLRDKSHKTISWKARTRLFQTNVVIILSSTICYCSLLYREATIIESLPRLENEPW